MIMSEERKSNRGLLDFDDFGEKDDAIVDFVSVIGSNRPLANIDEARIAALVLNNVMAFVEYGLSDHGSTSPGPEEFIFAGVGEIVRACRLTSLRVEQYLDLQENRPA